MAKSTQDIQAEFRAGSLKILGIMANPFIRREKKRETLCKFVDGLSQEAFDAYGLYILEIVNMKEKVCKEYADSEAQADGVLEWLPRMKEQRELLLAVIKEHRQKYGLEV